MSFLGGTIYTTKQIGDAGEKIAEEYIKKLGYKILEHNWKYSRIGEIDIIALDKKTVVFIEVKYRRSSSYGTAIEAITPKKLQRIYQSALAYLGQTTTKYNNYRLDVIAIDTSATPPLQHFQNISL